jgi:hypothetical protein
MEQSSTGSSSDGDPTSIGDDSEKRFSTKVNAQFSVHLAALKTLEYFIAFPSLHFLLGLD